MRVGVLTSSFPRSPEDGAGSFVLGFARALIRRQHQVEVLAPEPSEPWPAYHEPGLRLQHVSYLRPRALQRTFYGAGVPDNLARDPLAWLGPVPFTLALARRARVLSSGWDAVVSHWALPSALVAARVRAGRPHLAILHSADVHALCRLPARGWWARAISRGASALWFVSQAHRERFLALLPPAERSRVSDRSWVSPMGIDLPACRIAAASEQASARAALGLTRFTLLSLGRLVPVKGIDVLIRALAGRDVTLVVAGAGPEAARLQALSRSLRVDARFVGHVSGATKLALLTAANAFVAPSRIMPDGRSEGVPVALLEAMAHGLPIVASAVGGIPDLLPADESAGLLVAPDRREALARALDRVCHDDAWRTQARPVARMIAERHTWDHVIERAMAVLHTHRSLDFAATP